MNFCSVIRSWSIRVTQPDATSRSVVLPAGDDWIDFWTGKTITEDRRSLPMPRWTGFQSWLRKAALFRWGRSCSPHRDAEDPMEIRIYGGKRCRLLIVRGQRGWLCIRAWRQGNDSPALGPSQQYALDRGSHRCFPGHAKQADIPYRAGKRGARYWNRNGGRAGSYGNLHWTSDDDRSRQSRLSGGVAATETGFLICGSHHCQVEMD